MQTILLVEDNEMNRDMLARRLTRKGFSVITAEDGQQGIDYAIEQQPALILMDLSLPVVDGWEATRQLKANIATKHIPIIVLTAHAMKADEEKAFQAGCDDFDTKPVMLERLLEKMAKALTSE
ncbi:MULTISPECIES: response regulator [Bacillales]|uniref:Response regulator n=1 Tax=Lysinibacillus louembei TaxID=1470088 RepID=A0ABZ0RXT8_9BACI|nr:MULTISPECIES: response regulator [Bacillales]MCT6923125.1 response regulator [Metasolibacillus sp.]MCT6939570.1 response regulator [Metasolibacillus sp.]WPK11753.1 response regulator [Lysinibacillus louembei]